MKVLVCGGRDFHFPALVNQALDSLPFAPKMIIAGGAAGADTLAVEWAQLQGVHYAIVPALWDCYGKSAGAKRNQAMLELKPDYCVAFKGGRGTADMVRRCERKSIPIWRPCGE